MASCGHSTRRGGGPLLEETETHRTELNGKGQGDWPFYDWPSTVYATGFTADAIEQYGTIMTPERVGYTKGLLENGIGAAIALLTVSGTKVKTVNRADIDCPTGESFGFRQVTTTTNDPRSNQPITFTKTVAECQAGSIQQPLPALSASGADVASLPPAPACSDPCESSEQCGSLFRCSVGCCIPDVPK